VKTVAEPESLLIGERRVLELIATGTCLPTVLEALCRVIDEQSGQISSIYLLDREGRRLSFAAGPGVPQVWRDASKSILATAGNTACGTAVNSRRQVVVPDILGSPLYAAWGEVVRTSGISSVWSTPFYSEHGDVLGTFAVLSHTSQQPDAAQLALVDRATHLASIAVERHYREADLRESERRFSTAFYSSPACCTINRFSDGRFLYVNDKFISMFGYSRAEALGRTALDLDLWAEPARRSALWTMLHERGAAHDFEAEARTKSGKVINVLVWMERIQILSEECVLGITCDITDRKRAEEALAHSEQLLRTVLDTLPVGVAVTNADGDILLSNPVSKTIWGELLPTGRERYARSKGWWHDTGKPVRPEEWASARALGAGESAINEVVDIEAFNGVRKIIQNSSVPIRAGAGHITGAVIVNEEVSARVNAERELHESLAQMRALSGRLMRAQDDERRRIAQLLHETTAQDLAALKMLLARLVRTGAVLSDDDRAALTDSVELADRSMTAIRTLSYLLHPPFLDESGLVSALRWYAAGFADRSGIKVELDLPPTFQRLAQDVETALFRIVQEALINIHRHAGSDTARIALRVDDGQLTLDVEDRGRGMSPDLVAQLPAGGGALGVGIAGMRERLQQLGGTLAIDSSDRGTSVRARVPLAAPAS
jgi:PAS domain S-box-containing protein